MAVLSDRLGDSLMNAADHFGYRRVARIRSPTHIVTRIGDVLHLDIGVGLVGSLDRVVS